jgi:hypothetical protein
LIWVATSSIPNIEATQVFIGSHPSADNGGRAVIVNVSARKFVTYCNVLARMAFGSVAATAAWQAHIVQNTQYMHPNQSLEVHVLPP